MVTNSFIFNLYKVKSLISRYKDFIPLAILLLIVFISVLFLMFQQVYTSIYASDTQQHIAFLMKMFCSEESYYISHPLWHFCVWVFSKILHISIKASAVFFSTFLVVIWTMLVYMTVRRLTHLNAWIVTLVTMSIIFVAPLCIPWYNHQIYFGQGSLNIWHNVTIWMVKPFALLTTFYAILAFHNHKKINYLTMLVALILSIFAKPSFVIMFLPSLFFFALLKRILNKEFIFVFIMCIVVSVIPLIYQYIYTFGIEGNSRIIIDFLGVWSLKSQNIIASISLALAFPLFLVALYRKALEDDYILLSWLQVFVGIFYYATFAQTGRFYTHGNFGWSYDIAMSLLYLFSVVKFASVFKILKPWKRYSLLILLSIQVWIGFYYFVKILEGQNPLYISIFL